MKRFFSLSLLCLFFTVACQPDKKAPEQEAEQSSAAKDDSSASCKNPNTIETSPMAMGMRAMYEQAVIIRKKIVNGEDITASPFKMVDFIHAVPTDTNVLTDQFFIRAGRFKRAFADVFTDKNKSREHFNIMVNTCVECHSENCPGPLKKIKRLTIE